MNVRFLSLILCSILLSVLTISCEDEIERVDLPRYTAEEYAAISNVLNLPEIPVNYDVSFPRHINNFGNGTGVSIPIQKDMATLGRVLFYDKQLSVNNAVSCASCHHQENAFADPVDFSDGFEQVKTLRNAFALGTVASMDASYGGGFNISSSNFFWDNRAFTIEQQCEMTIQDPIEMGMSLEDLPAKLQNNAHYPILFKKAFGSEEIGQFQILSALAQFIRAMNTTNTKFDEGMNNLNFNEFADTDFQNFTDAENRGKALYLTNCASCHGETHARTNTSTANNGLATVYTDNGIGAISGFAPENGVFKVPMLRNVELTGPYMHDGSIATLEEVIDHYSENIQAHPNLNDQLKSIDGTPRKMNFTDQEKSDLIAFLKTLTDHTFIADSRFSDPFK